MHSSIYKENFAYIIFIIQLIIFVAPPRYASYRFIIAKGSLWRSFIRMSLFEMKIFIKYIIK